MRVRHFGNTANNAYYNSLLLKNYESIESELPISMFGLEHAFSAPAWETVDFEVPSGEWVASPDWSAIDHAPALNSQYSDLVNPGAPGAGSGEVLASGGISAAVMRMRMRVFGPLRTKAWAQPLVAMRDRQMLSRLPVAPELDGQINVLYGFTPVGVGKQSTQTVCVEHGTVRWLGDGPRQDRAYRNAYRTQVQRAQHLWVTNLDPRTLEIAEDVAPGRWSVLPHPFVPDSRVPFAESEPRRRAMLEQTASQFLVLQPSSQNWSKHHDKGSKKALAAFVELRRSGVDVGLVAVEWGLQVAESKAFLDEAGVGSNVLWVAPMARFALQRMMADVDVVWDQFGLEAFGALALRAVEQGTPMVSRGLAPIGEHMIGGPVPWLHAASSDEIVRETAAVFEKIGRTSRAAVIAETQERYRTWLLERHSPAMTAGLQRDAYTAILDGSYQMGGFPSDEWGRRLNGSDALDGQRR